MCGANWWIYLALVQRQEVAQWLAEQHLDLGSSEAPARHWLVLDRTAGRAWVLPWRQASAVVRLQRGPDDPPLPAGD